MLTDDMLGSLLICILYATYVGCQSAKFYTVHLTPKTWNEAREICAGNGGNLLSIADESEWNMWIQILNTTGHPNRPFESAYWFGLHDTGRVINGSSVYEWDSCTPADFTSPLADDGQSGYPCVVMWVHREIFLGYFLDRWFKGRPCNLTYPFVCANDVNDEPCLPTCTETIVTTATLIACNGLCLAGACVPHFLQQPSYCYIQPTSYVSDSTLTLCHLPDVTYVPTTCGDLSGFSVTYTNFVDSSVNIKNWSCDAATSSSILPSPGAELESRTSSLPPSATISLPTVPPIASSSIPVLDTNLTTQTCICSCQKLWTFLATPEAKVANLTIEEKVEIIVAELTVDKKNTTASQRRLISVMDDRPTSVGIGAVAAGIIFAIFGVIVIIDISRLWVQIMYLLRLIRLFLKGFKVGHKDPVAKLAQSTSRFNVMLVAPEFDKQNKKVKSTDLESLFGCKSAPKDKMLPPNDTHVPKIVVEAETDLSRKTESNRNTTLNRQLSVFDLADNAIDEPSIDTNMCFLDVPRKSQIKDTKSTETENQQNIQPDIFGTQKQGQVQFCEDGKMSDVIEQSNKPFTEARSRSRPIHKRPCFQPKVEWRYWK